MHLQHVEHVICVGPQLERAITALQFRNLVDTSNLVIDRKADLRVQIPYIVTDEQLGSSWCCSDLRAWDPAHASCEVPQVLSNAEIDRLLTVRTLLACRKCLFTVNVALGFGDVINKRSTHTTRKSWSDFSYVCLDARACLGVTTL